MKTTIAAALILALSLPLYAGKGAGKQHGPKGLSKLDTNGDSSLSKDEFAAGAKDPAKAGRAFRKLDTNKDDKISAEEFVAAKGAKDGKKGAKKDGKKDGKKGGKKDGKKGAKKNK